MALPKWFRKRNNEKGAVTVEATIALTAYLFMFLMVYSIVSICRAQATIQVAINATAKEISQYSYVYGLTGLGDSLSKFQEAGQTTEDKLNNTVGTVADVFNGIQTIGKSAEESAEQIKSMNIQGTLDSWGKISTQMDENSASLQTLQEQIEDMAKNPQELLLGMARLIGSKALEEAKSRLIAEPVARSLVKKHLKRSDNDTAEAFCKSVGIVPDTYWGKQSYFNGIDFSHSTLFPYGSDEITIVANYKVKLLPLLPIDLEFHVTQKAVTKGWLHGDLGVSGDSPKEKIEKLKQEADGSSIWNSMSVSERTALIRSMGIEALKDDKFEPVSCETHIQAYDRVNNTFAMVVSSNRLYGLDSIEDIDKDQIRADIKNWAAQMNSATQGIQSIKIKTQDKYGNVTTSEVSCSGKANKRIILVIPQDEGLQAIYEEILTETGGYGVQFEIQPGYGKAFKTDTSEKESTGNTEGGQG